jgi:hypothetical protein
MDTAFRLGVCFRWVREAEMVLSQRLAKTATNSAIFGFDSCPIRKGDKPPTDMCAKGGFESQPRASRSSFRRGDSAGYRPTRDRSPYCAVRVRQNDE